MVSPVLCSYDLVIRGDTARRNICVFHRIIPKRTFELIGRRVLYELHQIITVAELNPCADRQIR